jgi:regulator of sigma E protease
MGSRARGVIVLTLIAFVFVLGVLIFVHELGHFLAAKALGIGVPRFSIGFGPATPLSFQRGETTYVVSWVPLGGYVKMASREEQEAMASLEGGPAPEEFPPEKLFENKSLGARIVVISAGVLMNFAFAWFTYTALDAILGRTEDPTTTVARVETAGLPLGAEALAQVAPGSQVVRINGDTVRVWNDVRRLVLEPKSPRLRFDIAGADPVIVDIAGTDAESRFAVLDALRPAWPATIGSLNPAMPATRAGLQVGDRFVLLNGDSVRYWDDIQRPISASAGVALHLTMQRGDSLFERSIVPEAATERDPLTGDARQVGRIGIGPALDLVHVEYGLLRALGSGARRTLDQTADVYFTIKGMLVGDVSPRQLGGPILIGQASGQVAQLGLAALFGFMAFLSVNLAVLNLLPIPVLDGGHLVFLLIEGVRGRPLPLQLRLRLTQIGMVLLIGLMLFVLTNDVLRLTGG